MVLALKYSLFALLATLTNIACQHAVTRLYGGRYELYAAMAAGTLAGLALKYVLDKKYIFFFKSKGMAHDGRKFVLYSLMGVLTTVLFWSVEMGFDYAFESVPMRYAGAVIGLGLGYLLKYRLDKRFVFVEYA